MDIIATYVTDRLNVAVCVCLSLSVCHSPTTELETSLAIIYHMKKGIKTIFFNLNPRGNFRSV